MDRCGTALGYLDHRRADEHACADCRAAWRDYYAARRGIGAFDSQATCEWCGDQFTRATRRRRFCSDACRNGLVRRTRRARRAGAKGSFTWSQVVRIFLLFDRRCAYCQVVIEGQPEPDHVVALSQGGANDIGNILPACGPCNRDKSGMTLDEWKASRARRGLPPVVTSWSQTDIRFAHLTSVASPA